jgi:hypothetical protein
LQAVLFGTAKATKRHPSNDALGALGYRAEQREAILRRFDRYNLESMIVSNIDLGRKDPQRTPPYSGWIRPSLNGGIDAYFI